MMDKFIKETSMYTLALGSALLISYAFHILATRLLGVVGYGVFSKYFGLLTFLTLPTFLVQSYVAREIASGRNPTKRVLIDLMKVLIPIAILLPIFDFNFIFISVAIISYALYIYRGYLQGKHDSRTLSINLVLEPIFRVIFLLLLVYFFHIGFAGALLAFTLAYIVVLIPSYKIEWGSDKANLLSLLIFFVVSLAVTFPTSLGLTLASYSLSPVELSKYSVLILLSKLLVFISFSIGMAYLPLAVENYNNHRSSKREFHISIYLLIAASFLFIIYPKFFTFFFPSDYSTAIITHLPILSISMLLIGISYIFMNKMWAERKDYFTLIPSSVFIAMQLYFLKTYNTLHLQSLGLLYSSITLLILTLLFNFVKVRK